MPNPNDVSDAIFIAHKLFHIDLKLDLLDQKLDCLTAYLEGKDKKEVQKIVDSIKGITSKLQTALKETTPQK